MTPILLDDLAIAQRLLTTTDSIAAVSKALGVGRNRITKAYHAHSTPEQRNAAFCAKISASRKQVIAKREPWYDWDSVNWLWPDAVVARRLGCCVQAARVARSRLGKPRSFCHRQSERLIRVLGVRRKVRERNEAVIASRILTSDATCESIADELGLSTVTIWNIYRRHTTREQRQQSRNQKISAAMKVSRTVAGRMAAERAAHFRAMQEVAA